MDEGRRAPAQGVFQSSNAATGDREEDEANRAGASAKGGNPWYRPGTSPLTACYHPRMPRDGSLTLSDVRGPTLSIVCEPWDGGGGTVVAKLMEQHGDAKLTDLLQALADCPKARRASIRDRCKAVYEQLLP